MIDSEIKSIVNNFELRCPECDGNVSILAIGPKGVNFKHNLPTPGQRIPSNQAKCSFFDQKIRELVRIAQNDEIELVELKEKLEAACRRL